jgi:hypothetical protein
MFCNDCQHQYHGEHICEPDPAPYRDMDFTPTLGPGQFRELQKVLKIAHTTPRSLGADIENMAQAAAAFFGFEVRES